MKKTAREERLELALKKYNSTIKNKADHLSVSEATIESLSDEEFDRFVSGIYEAGEALQSLKI